MTTAIFNKSRGRVLAIFGAEADRVVERQHFIKQAEQEGATLDGWVLKYPNGRRVWCDYECAHELKPVQVDLFEVAA